MCPVVIGSDNGLELDSWQTIILINVKQVAWLHVVSLCHSVLKDE